MQYSGSGRQPQPAQGAAATSVGGHMGKIPQMANGLPANVQTQFM